MTDNTMAKTKRSKTQTCSADSPTGLVHIQWAPFLLFKITAECVSVTVNVNKLISLLHKNSGNQSARNSMTDNTMAKTKRSKTLHRKVEIEQHEPH
jgi:hypothetical protein